MILQKNMVSKCCLFIITIFSIRCSHVDYQKVIIDNNINSVTIVNPDFVIDSISLNKPGDTILSISLIDKTGGANQIYLNNTSQLYKTYKNKLFDLNCQTKDLSMSIIIRRKGSNTKVNEKIANGFTVHPDIQTLRGYNFIPCLKTIDTIETDRHFR